MPRIPRLSSLLAAFAMVAIAPNAASARDVTIDSLVGRWCGPTTEYTFTRSDLTVHSRQGRKLTHGPVLEIEKVETGDGWIELKWKGLGTTVFWRFSNDGKAMSQQAQKAGDKGPEMRFHRC